MMISVCSRRWPFSKTLVLGALVCAGTPAAFAAAAAEPVAVPATPAAVTAEAAAAPAAEVKAAAPEAPAPAVAAEAPAGPVVLRLGTVAANVLNLRARPGENYEVIGKFQRGEEVKVISEKGDWLEVLVPERVEAWVASLYVDAEGKVVADRIRVHAGPGVVFSTYAFVTRGMVLKKIGQPSADGWQKIAAPASATAWISKKYIEAKTVVPATAPAGAPAATPATTPMPVPATGPAAGPATPAAGPTPAAVVDLHAKPAATPLASAPAAALPDERVAAVAAAVAAQSADTPPASAATKVEPAQTEAATAAAAEATASQTPAPPPIVTPVTPSAVAPAESATPAPGERTVTRLGVISSLKDQSSAVCTHLLAVQVGQKLFSDCYLVSSRIALNEWEGQTVRITAKEVWYAGWKRAVLDVTGIERIEP